MAGRWLARLGRVDCVGLRDQSKSPPAFFLCRLRQGRAFPTQSVLLMLSLGPRVALTFYKAPSVLSLTQT